MHVQLCVYGLSCCLFGHDIDTACYYYPPPLFTAEYTMAQTAAVPSVTSLVPVYYGGYETPHVLHRPRYTPHLQLS